MLSSLRRFWRPALVVGSGLAAIFLMDTKAYGSVSQELMALFGLMMAAVLPTMVLTASVLRPGRLSVKRLTEYSDALATQLKIWIGLFLVALIASLCVVVGKMVGWSVPVAVDLSSAKLGLIQVDLIVLVNGLITACLVLIVLRGLAVGHGIASILRLSSEISIGEAKARDEERHRATEQAISDIKPREGFGSYVDLPH